MVVEAMMGILDFPIFLSDLLVCSASTPSVYVSCSLL